MKKLIMIASLFFTADAFAQLTIKDQPGNTYYDAVKNWCTGKVPAQKELLAMKPAPVSGFNLDTLKKYDWVEVGGYSYTDKTYEDYFAKQNFVNEAEQQYQFRLFRIMNDGIRAEFSLSRFKSNDATVTTTSFDKNTSMKYKGIKVAKMISFIEMEIFGSTEYTKVVSYKNGVLVIDISKSGQITAPAPRFRNVYYAIPKKFDWDFGQ